MITQLTARVLKTRAVFYFAMGFIFFTGCKDTSLPIAPEKNEGKLYIKNIKTGKIKITFPYRLKAFSATELHKYYALATKNNVAIFDFQTGVKILLHNLTETFNANVIDIEAFVIDSTNYIIKTKTHLFVYNHGNFQEIKIADFMNPNIVIENLTPPAFDAKHNKLCVAVIDHNNRDLRRHLFDYNHIGVIDLNAPKISILPIKYPARLKSIGDYVVPYSYINYSDGYFSLSESTSDTVYIIDAKNLRVLVREMKSRLDDFSNIKLSGKTKISKAQNQEFGFKYLKSWYSKADSTLYRLARLTRPTKLSDSTFSTSEDFAYSLLKLDLSNNSTTEIKLGHFNIRQDIEIFKYEDMICHRTNNVHNATDSTSVFIYNCYSIR